MSGSSSECEAEQEEGEEEPSFDRGGDWVVVPQTPIPGMKYTKAVIPVQTAMGSMDPRRTVPKLTGANPSGSTRSFHSLMWWRVTQCSSVMP
ncbi:hypothetical protein ACIPUC_00030 [Streptomyces sp. LARHCF249]